MQNEARVTRYMATYKLKPQSVADRIVSLGEEGAELAGQMMERMDGAEVVAFCKRLLPLYGRAVEMAWKQRIAEAGNERAT